MLEKLLRSKTAMNVLGIVLFQNGLHLREIARQAGTSSFQAKRELDLLCEIGLLKKQKRGNQVLFDTNPECRFLPDLKNLYRKTEGFIIELKTVLSALPPIKYAFIFGSTASGREKPHSDIDLMVIGDISEKIISEKIFEIQKKNRREINFILWSEQTLSDKIGKKSPFLNNIMKKDIIWLVGNRDEFIRTLEKRTGPYDRT